MYNKKGLGPFLVIILSFIVLLFFIAVFAGISGVLKSCSYKQEKVQKLSSKISLEAEADLQLLNFLRTPILFENENITMADLILASSDEGCKHSGFSEGTFRADPNQYQHSCEKEPGKDYDSEKLILESKKIFDSLFGQGLWYVEVSHPNFKTQDGFDFNVVFPYNEEGGTLKGQDNKGLLPNRCNYKFHVNEIDSVVVGSAAIPTKDGLMTVILGFCKRAI